MTNRPIPTGRSRQFPLVALCAGALMMALATCGGRSDTVELAPNAALADPPKGIAQYATYARHYLALEKAAKDGDYAQFVDLVGAADNPAFRHRLNIRFGGHPFEVFTHRTSTTDTVHRRLIELRGGPRSVFLVVRLERVTDGWRFAGFGFGEDREAMLARF